MGIKWNNVKYSGQSKVKRHPDSRGIGPSELIAGDMQAGFFGEVTTSELFTGPELATAIGLTAGTTQYDNESWLKFAYEGNILYVAKKPYRYGLSWDQIDAVNAVYGGQNDAEVYKSGYSFKVRLLKGASNDPTEWDENDSEDDPPEGIGSEWNDLIYRIHGDVPNTQEGSNWANYAQSETLVEGGDSSATWCQEKPSYDTTRSVRRGNSLSRFSTSGSSLTGTFYGWRPVLQQL